MWVPPTWKIAVPPGRRLRRIFATIPGVARGRAVAPVDRGDDVARRAARGLASVENRHRHVVQGQVLVPRDVDGDGAVSGASTTVNDPVEAVSPAVPCRYRGP